MSPIRSSARASCRPVHRCTPPPNDTCPAAERVRSSTSGFGNRTGSRLAAASDIVTDSPALTSVPATSTSSTAVRTGPMWLTVRYRSSSSTALSTNDGSARSAASCSGCSSSANTPSVNVFDVVSWPAISRIIATVTSSPSSSSPLATSLPSTSSVGSSCFALMAVVRKSIIDSQEATVSSSDALRSNSVSESCWKRSCSA